MGEIAELMLEGALCTVCGERLGDACGYPRMCAGCELRDENAGLRRSPKVSCPTCGKRVKRVGLANHQRDAHGVNDER